MGKSNAKVVAWSIGILVFLLVVSLIGNGIAWNNRSATGKLIAGVQDELQTALGRNSDLKAELQRSETGLTELTDSLQQSEDQLRRARKELERANGYIARLEGQIGISEESLGRIEALVDRGNELVAEGESYLQEGTD